jgi:hypothetical protein
VETSGLIRHLAADATRVHRLPPPWLRTAMWLAISLPYICAVVVMKPAAIDFLGKIDARFVLEQAAILATAFTAAIAAFASVIPGHHRKIYLLPLVPLAVWLASLGQGCAHDWLRFGADGLQVRPDWECAPAAIFIGIIPAVAMVVMLRRGAPLAPRISVGLGALAVAALGNFGLRIYHIGDVSIMVLVWHFGSVALISILAGWAGRHVLSWRSLLRPAVPTELLKRSIL